MKFQNVGPFEIYSWSIAGHETCVAVRYEGLCFAFDMGFSPPPLVQADYVFISHGHADHVGAIAQHMKKRKLNSLPKAVYFLPPNLIHPVRAICNAFSIMNETTGESPYECPLVEISPYSKIPITKNWYVKAIPTDHKVKSQGYILFRNTAGVDNPEIAYLGDSRFTVLLGAIESIPALLQTRLLIMETTFLDRPEKLLSKAHCYGHTHMDELRQHSHIFQAVEYVYLIHFSARYTPEQIVQLTKANLPPWLSSRIIPSLSAQRCIQANL